MRIAILGMGGIGGYLGAKLASTGCDVVFIARGAQYDAIRRNGLKLESPLGDIDIASANVTDDVSGIGRADFAIVGVKLWDTEQAARLLVPIAERGGAVISFQNGVQKDDILGTYLPAHSVVGGVCYIASAIVRPGVIRHSGTMQRFVFGEYVGGRTGRLEGLREALQRAGVEAEISPAIERLIWEKFVFLVGLSGTTATIRKSIGPIRADARTRMFLRDVMREVVAVARAKGVSLSIDYADEQLAFFDTLPETMISSMLGDLQRGGRLELAWLSGGVVELGAALGVPTPLNRAISDILLLHAQGQQP